MSRLKRPLFTDFQLYAEGDSDFKNELIVLMVTNILELKRATDLSMGEFDPLAFRELYHKSATTLSILADEEFKRIAGEINRNSDSGEKITLLNGLCSQVIESLQAELTITVNGVYPAR